MRSFMALMAGRRSRSLKLVIQRTRSCSSGVQRGIRVFALVNAAGSGMPPSEAMERVAYPRANWGSLAIACFAAEIASSWRWFSYLSRESSIRRRASVERVDKGRLPYSLRRVPGSTVAGAASALRDVVGSRCEAEFCAQAGMAKSDGKINKSQRVTKRFMGTHSLFKRKVNDLLLHENIVSYPG